jgi:tRNA (pseudouridine54-N1)-methyltransferase
MLRKFLIRAATASTNPSFDTHDLPRAGRMDLLCRSIADAIFISSHLRDDTIVYAVLEGSPSPSITVTFDTRELKNIDETEKRIAELIKKAMNGKEHPGVKAEKKSFEAVIREEAEKSDVFYLSKKGDDIRSIEFGSKKDLLFIIGGHTGIPKKTEKFIARFSPKKIMVSPAMVFSSHCIILIHNELDRKR